MEIDPVFDSSMMSAFSRSFFVAVLLVVTADVAAYTVDDTGANANRPATATTPMRFPCFKNLI